MGVVVVVVLGRLVIPKVLDSARLCGRPNKSG